MAGKVSKIDAKIGVTSDPDVRAEGLYALDHSAIATRAFELWQHRGCPTGSDQEDWFRAEEELRTEAVHLAKTA